MPEERIESLGRFLNPDDPAAKIFQAIQATNDSGYVEGDLLVSYVAVCEWMTPDGEKYVSRLDSELYPWERDGLLREVLNWSDDDDE